MFMIKLLDKWGAWLNKRRTEFLAYQCTCGTCKGATFMPKWLIIPIHVFAQYTTNIGQLLFWIPALIWVCTREAWNRAVSTMAHSNNIGYRLRMTEKDIIEECDEVKRQLAANPFMSGAVRENRCPAKDAASGPEDSEIIVSRSSEYTH